MTTPENEVADLQTRVKRLEDLEAIRQLFVAYGSLLDQCDFAAYGKLFADDGELLLGPMGRARGPAAIGELMQSRLGGGKGSSYHLIANPIIDLQGDRATSVVTWAAILRGAEGGPTLGMYGFHHDILVRQAGAWKFLRREGHIALPSKMPSAPK